MAQAGFFSSSIVKKVFMSLTGLFLCTFLVAHLVGNLQLIFYTGEEGRQMFNDYSTMMTTNPIIIIVSYLTYFSILFHAIQGLYLAYKNRQARPSGYAYNKPSKNSLWSSRNMGILGTIILVFIVVHMSSFWYGYKFGDMPVLTEQTTNAPILKATGEPIPGGEVKAGSGGMIYKDGAAVGLGKKDLYTEVIGAFKVEWYVAFYVFCMIAIGFHLYHGFQSAFQSLGLRHKRYTPLIVRAGQAFSIIVAAAFAVIPVYVYFCVKLPIA